MPENPAPPNSELRESVRWAAGLGVAAVFGVLFVAFALPWLNHLNVTGDEAPSFLARVEAIYDDGEITVRGAFPDQQAADEAVALAADAVGEENVVADFTIDPTISEDAEISLALILRDLVLFDTGSAVLAPEFLPALDVAQTVLDRRPASTVTVSGHTDDRGTEESNLALSEARVDSIANYLIAGGIAGDRITEIAHGESQPIAENTTEVGRQMNRRVEIVFSDAVSAEAESPQQDSGGGEGN